jgi:hypothetical protein
MKKFVVLIAALLLVSGSVFAADLAVKGNVAQVMTIGVTYATGSDVTLEIDGSGDAVEAVSAANLTLVTNQKSWTITFASTGGLSVLSAVGSNDTIPYQVKVDTSSFSAGVATNNLSSYTSLLTATNRTIVSATTGAGGKTSFTGVSLPISVNIPAYTSFFQNVGTGTSTVYSDTVVITIAAN